MYTVDLLNVFFFWQIGQKDPIVTSRSFSFHLYHSINVWWLSHKLIFALYLNTQSTLGFEQSDNTQLLGVIYFMMQNRVQDTPRQNHFNNRVSGPKQPEKKIDVLKGVQTSMKLCRQLLNSVYHYVVISRSHFPPFSSRGLWHNDNTSLEN